MVTTYFHPLPIPQRMIGDWRIVVSCSFMQILSITFQGPLNFARKNDLETNNFHALHAIEFFMTMPAYDKHMKEVQHGIKNIS